MGVNLSGGKTRDGGSVVGASVFYNDVAGTDADGNKQRTGSQSSLDRLDQELKVRSLYGMLNSLYSYIPLLFICCLNLITKYIVSGHSFSQEVTNARCLRQEEKTQNIVNSSLRLSLLLSLRRQSISEHSSVLLVLVELPALRGTKGTKVSETNIKWWHSVFMNLINWTEILLRA